MPRRLSRRRFVTASASSMAALGAVPVLAGTGTSAAQTRPGTGRLKQSVCRWTLPGTLPEVCRRTKNLGLKGIDLLFPDEWEVARAAGLTCSMGYGSRRERFIEDGFNDPACIRC
jgi:hydroxypyruvate isomerase